MCTHINSKLTNTNNTLQSNAQEDTINSDLNKKKQKGKQKGKARKVSGIIAIYQRLSNKYVISNNRRSICMERNELLMFQVGELYVYVYLYMVNNGELLRAAVTDWGWETGGTRGVLTRFGERRTGTEGSQIRSIWPLQATHTPDSAEPTQTGGRRRRRRKRRRRRRRRRTGDPLHLHRN